jgi:GNAT superfamily N-acetyltransferase
MPIRNWDTVNATAETIPGQTLELPTAAPPEPASPWASLGSNPVTDVAASALRQNNIVSNLSGFRPKPPAVPGYNPIADAVVQGFEDNLDRFIRSDSPEESRAIAARIGMENADRKVLGQAGGWGLAASVAAGMVDPVTLASMALPLAAPVTWGSRAARIGAGVAAQVGADTGAEALFHATQETRTLEESMLNIGAGALLTGAFGTLATRVPKTEFDLMRKQLQSELNELPNTGGSTVGAASVRDFTTLDDETIAKGGRFLGMTMGKISPVTRLMQSPLKSVRQLAQKMVEVPYLLEKNFKGMATASSVETDIKRRIARRRIDVVNSLEESFAKYSQRLGSEAQPLSAFKEMISAAARREDKTDVPEIREVLGVMRKMFDDDRTAMQELGVLPEEFDLVGAKSYFSRVWNHDAIAGNRNDFESRLFQWFKANPKLLMPSDEVLSSAEGAPSSNARFFSEDFVGVPEARSVVLRDNGGHEVGRSVLMERGDNLQIVRAQLAPGWKGRGYGQRMIIDALTEAEKLGKNLQSDSAVSVDQLRAYEGLRRKGYRVEYFDEEAVQKALKDKTDLDAGQPVVKKIVSPTRVLEELNALQKVVRETLKAAKEAYTGAKLGNKQARLALNRSLRRAHKIEDKINDLMGEEQTPRITEVIERLKRRLVKEDERAQVLKPKALDTEADQAAKWKERRAEQVELRKIQRAIRKANAAIADAKRVKKHNDDIAAKAQPVHMEDAEVQTAVMETLDRIMGTARGLADVHRAPSAGPTKHRVLDVPDEILEPYLVNDFERVMNGYISAMVPQLEMRRAFGSSTLQAQKDEIMDSSRAAINSLTNVKDKEKLRKATADAIRDLDGMRDRLLGHSGPKGHVPLSFVRAQRVVRSYNYIRLLGSQMLSSFSDYGHLISRYGLTRTAGMTAKFLTNMRANKLTRADAKRMGTALEWTLDSRSSTLAEIGDELAGSKIEAGAQWAAKKFTRATGMATWNSALKAMTAGLEQDAIIRAMRKEKLTPMEQAKLAQNGIGAEHYDRIRDQLAKYGDDSDGLNRARTEMWDDKEAARLVEDAVVKSADIMVVTRGVGDLPLFMDSEVAKTLMQFKSFGMSATNRVLMPLAQGLARGDVASANGLMAMLALGGMTYVVKELAAGREPDLSAARMIPEALNWSGALAYMPDIYDPIAGLVHAPRLSRYSNHRPIETFLGPTLGTATEAYATIAGLTDLGIKQQDLHRLRMMMPMQNVFYLRRIINALEGEAGQAVDAEGATGGSFVDRVTETTPPQSNAGL